jgi:hypothetical protein
LQDVIDGTTQRRAGSKEKAEIALMLATCLLEFFADNIELAAYSWDPENIFFVNSSTTSYKSRGDIYVSLKPTPFETKSVDLLNDFRAGNPTMLSFARLLLEIETGERMQIQIYPETQKNIKSWAYLCSLVQMKKDNGESVQYLEAVEGCLHLCNSMPKLEDRATGSDARKVLRKAIYEKVVRALKEVVQALEEVANSHNSKRKRGNSAADHPQAKKPPTSRLSGVESLTAALTYSERSAATPVVRDLTFAGPPGDPKQPDHPSQKPIHDMQGDESKTTGHSTSKRVIRSNDVLCARSKPKLSEKQPLDHTLNVTNGPSVSLCVSSTNFGKSTLSKARSGSVFVQRYAMRVAPWSSWTNASSGRVTRPQKRGSVGSRSLPTICS